MVNRLSLISRHDIEIFSSDPGDYIVCEKMQDYITKEIRSSNHYVGVLEERIKKELMNKYYIVTMTIMYPFNEVLLKFFKNSNSDLAGELALTVKFYYNA
jgi:hypothetical protein